MPRRRAHLLLLAAFAVLTTLPGPASASPVEDTATRLSERSNCLQMPEPQRWSAVGTPDQGRADAVISAHRGGNHLAPENTLPAYEHAFAYGSEMVEADVRTTADGVLVSLHDDTVDRTTDGEGALADLTYAEVAALNAADYAPWTGSAYDPARIATLEEVVALAAQLGRGVEFDIKDADALEIADLAARYGILEDSAFNTADPRVTARYPQARLIYNRDTFEPAEGLYALAASDTYGVFGSRLDEYTAEDIAAIHDGCGIVMPHAYDGTFGDEAEDLVQMRQMGADGAQVNQPDVAAAALGEPVVTDIVTRADRPAARPVLTSEELVNGLYRQGVARVPGGWVFSYNSALVRTDDDLNIEVVASDAIPADLQAAGYNHLGDADADGGLLYVPLEQGDYARDLQRIAVYDAISLAFVTSYEVELSHAAWVAVDGDRAWSMDHFNGEELVQFSLPEFKPIRRLQLAQPLARVQGGDVGPDGTLWLSTDDDRSMVYAVDTTSGRVRTVGSMGHLPGEGEGIDVTPLPDGLLHTLQVDPDLIAVWFGHWSVPQTGLGPVPAPGDVCLVDSATGLGLPNLELRADNAPAGTTGHDGCLRPAGGAATITFDGTGAALPSTRSGRDLPVDDGDGPDGKG